ncbi:MAG: iron-sulfur cluster assembly scaffold protein [Desulfovibrionaceae bacterium]
MHTESTLENLSPKFLRHMQTPENLGELDAPSGHARLTGQCGDSIGLSIQVEGDAIRAIRVQPEGCAYTLVCASAVSVLAADRALDDVLTLTPQDVIDEVGGLPEDHHHCARLALNALGEAIADYLEQASKRLRTS